MNILQLQCIACVLSSPIKTNIVLYRIVHSPNSILQFVLKTLPSSAQFSVNVESKGDTPAAVKEIVSCVSCAQECRLVAEMYWPQPPIWPIRRYKFYLCQHKVVRKGISFMQAVLLLYLKAATINFSFSLISLLFLCYSRFGRVPSIEPLRIAVAGFL